MKVQVAILVFMAAVCALDNGTENAIVPSLDENVKQVDFHKVKEDDVVNSSCTEFSLEFSASADGEGIELSNGNVVYDLDFSADYSFQSEKEEELNKK